MGSKIEKIVVQYLLPCLEGVLLLFPPPPPRLLTAVDPDLLCILGFATSTLPYPPFLFRTLPLDFPEPHNFPLARF